jgi:hypothetical protein
MNPPKHLVSAAAIVINEKNELLLIMDQEEAGRCLVVKLKKENP